MFDYTEKYLKKEFKYKFAVSMTDFVKEQSLSSGLGTCHQSIPLTKLEDELHQNQEQSETKESPKPKAKELPFRDEMIKHEQIVKIMINKQFGQNGELNNISGHTIHSMETLTDGSAIHAMQTPLKANGYVQIHAYKYIAKNCVIFLRYHDETTLKVQSLNTPETSDDYNWYKHDSWYTSHPWHTNGKWDMMAEKKYSSWDNVFTNVRQETFAADNRVIINLMGSAVFVILIPKDVSVELYSESRHKIPISCDKDMKIKKFSDFDRGYIRPLTRSTFKKKVSFDVKTIESKQIIIDSEEESTEYSDVKQRKGLNQKKQLCPLKKK